MPTLRSLFCLLLASSVLLFFPKKAAGQFDLQVLKSFDGPTGSQPYTSLIEGSDSRLYGTTFSGGTNSTRGTVFRMSTDGSGFEVLRHFASGAGGSRPVGGVIEGQDGLLYGILGTGGSNGLNGVIFKMRKDGGDYVAFKHFTGTAADGRQPQAGLIEGSDGLLYGTTFGAGTSVPGNVFKVAKDGSGFTLLHRFEGTGDGSLPWAELLEGSDGAIYGTTYSGTTGTSLFGTLFKVNKDGSGYLVLRRCDLASGSYPYGGLIEAPDGALYGTTSGGGMNLSGTIFRINKNGTGHTVLHHFTGDGSEPRGKLAIGPDGMLYGTTFGGGIGTNGIVYKISLNGNGFTVLRRFADNGSDPKKSSAGVLVMGNGDIYGTTAFGGGQNVGTVFRLIPTSQDPATLSITKETGGYLLNLHGGTVGKT